MPSGTPVWLAHSDGTRSCEFTSLVGEMLACLVDSYNRYTVQEAHLKAHVVSYKKDALSLETSKTCQDESHTCG